MRTLSLDEVDAVSGGGKGWYSDGASCVFIDDGGIQQVVPSLVGDLGAIIIGGWAAAGEYLRGMGLFDQWINYIG